MATTPADLVTFARALFDGTLLDDAALAELTDSAGDGADPSDSSPSATGGGATTAAPWFQAVYAHDPDLGATVALFTNCPTCAEGTPDTWQAVAEMVATVER